MQLDKTFAAAGTATSQNVSRKTVFYSYKAWIIKRCSKRSVEMMIRSSGIWSCKCSTIVIHNSRVTHRPVL